jgi:SAM-dependent methyltransferase
MDCSNNPKVMDMDRRQIEAHWKNWATTYGSDLRATTKSRTAKALELDALKRRFDVILETTTVKRVLEAGCGNGVNCVELAKKFSGIHFDGTDLIPEMVAAAVENSSVNGVEHRTRFFQGEVLDIDSIDDLETTYDIVFTVRCLINLNEVALQKKAITTLASRVRQGGYLLMIENSSATYGKQNECRELLGLEARVPAAFNLFFDETEIRSHIANIGLKLIDVEDFSSLHDLMLYVLLPSINNGLVDYEHPLVQATAALSADISAHEPGVFGKFGQNRLFVCRSPD